jgi:DeoR family transcriptional regulator, copper-sensing transcriptional repressor
MSPLTERQQLLLDWLQTQRSASIAEIETYFSISPATAYRDARALVQTGEALKTTNGIKLAPPASEKCVFCGGSINERLAFVFQLQDGGQSKACCPHCGLMALGKLNVESALTSDFLYGRMINVRNAFFLLASSVNLCCSPSVLCFSSEADASNFQAGFGGQICGLERAVEQLGKMMSM